jgi:hypothetical protein
MKFKVFTVADIMLTIFWDVMPPIFYRQIQIFWQNQLPPSSYSSILKTETAGSSNTLAFIQGVSRLVDITAGGDFLGLCDQKSSYKHVSDFGRLQSYGQLWEL